MTREYMDEQYLKLMQDVDDEAGIEEAKSVLEQEIAAQDITGGQAIIHGQIVTFASRELLNGKMKVTLPEEWRDMELQFIKLKYPQESRPPVILTDSTTAINLTLNPLAQQLKPEELEAFKNTMKLVTGKMTKACFIEDGMIEAGEGEVPKSWFDFTVEGLDAKLYNLIFFLSLEERALLVTFNCLAKDQKRWKPIVFDMMKTIELKAQYRIRA